MNQHPILEIEQHLLASQELLKQMLELKKEIADLIPEQWKDDLQLPQLSFDLSTVSKQEYQKRTEECLCSAALSVLEKKAMGYSAWLRLAPMANSEASDDS